MKTISLRKISVSDSVLSLLKPAFAHRYSVLPISFEEERLTVAIDPESELYEIHDALESETGLIVQAVFADNREDLKTALRRYYPPVTANSSNVASDLFNNILNRALQLRASDIHIGPKQNFAIVELRIDGALRVDRQIDLNLLSELTAVIKIAAGLDIAEKRTPLDGSINTKLGEEDVSLRVATLPTIYGEHITLRLLSQDHGEELEQLSALGLSPIHEKMIRSALDDPNGIILLSGPTGSGKTTTLYAALRHLREDSSMRLISIEDPVEKPVDGVTQVKVDPDGERLTFNKALRSVLRHDPDVIMIGEIRDGETGDIAVKSALTGHLVLSTLHTNSASGVITRLINLGIAPFLVASTMRLAIAQRLVRVPCPHCVQFVRPTPDVCEIFGWDPDDETLQIPEVKGCSLCGGKGYAGRLGLYEFIPIDDRLREHILNNISERDIEIYAFKERKYPSLLDDGGWKILAGKTTVKEVLRVANRKI